MDTDFCSSMKKVAVFHSEYLKKDLDIMAIPKSGKKYSLIIFCQPQADFGPTEKYNNDREIKFCFELSSINIDYFKGQIEKMKEEYLKLAQNAEINDVQALDHTLLTNFTPTTFRFSYGDKCYSAISEMKAYFQSVSDVYLCVMTSGKMIPMEDAELHVMGGYIPFASTEEIDNFVKVVEEGAFNALNEES